jgi:hypothetical protein
MTPGERRAWRQGFAEGVRHSAQQLELFRIRFACRGIDIDAPIRWPTVTRGEKRAAS